MIENHEPMRNEMKHNSDDQTSYPKTCITMLNKFGTLTSPWLIKHLQVHLFKARKILDEISINFSNVIKISDDQIIVDGWGSYEVKFSKRFMRSDKKWKDVTKP